MRINFLLLIFIFILSASNTNAQSRHYTLFDDAPLTLNPAFTGAFKGTYRIGGIYRNQLTGFSGGLYNTPNIYIDLPLIRGFGKYDWVGVGANIVVDRAGTTATRSRSAYGGSVAYHLALDKKRNQVFTIGVYAGFVTNNFENVILQDQNELSRDFNGSHLNLNAGLKFKSKIDKKNETEFGFSLNNLTGATEGHSFVGDSVQVSQSLLFTGHAMYERQINDLWSAQPKVFVQSIAGGGIDASIQAWVGRNLISKEDAQEAKKSRKKIKKDKVAYAGLGYRFGNAVQLLLAYEMKNIRISASYDITLSQQRVIDNTVGGFEISASYIGKIYKQPNIKPVLFCPRF